LFTGYLRISKVNCAIQNPDDHHQAAQRPSSCSKIIYNLYL
jgi:hypothetical protein